MANPNKVSKFVNEKTGLLYKPEAGFYGQYGGYTVNIMPINNGAQYILRLEAKNAQGEGPTAENLSLMKSGCQAIDKATATGIHTSFTIKKKMKAEEQAANIVEALNYVTSTLQGYGFRSACGSCGEERPTEVVRVGNGFAMLCEECYNKVTADSMSKQVELEAKPENVPAGALGALLGALVGGLAIVVISRLGFISLFSGLIMGIATIKGYELLGGKITKKGIIISVIAMIAVVWLADRIDWAISVAQETGWGFFESFRSLPYLFSEGYLDRGLYFGNLGMLYLFTLAGAGAMIFSIVKAKKNENTTSRL